MQDKIRYITAMFCRCCADNSPSPVIHGALQYTSQNLVMQNYAEGIQPYPISMPRPVNQSHMTRSMPRYLSDVRNIPGDETQHTTILAFMRAGSTQQS